MKGTFSVTHSAFRAASPVESMSTTPPDIRVEAPADDDPTPSAGTPVDVRGAGVRFREFRQKRPWVVEIGIFALALLVYQGSRVMVMGHPNTAFENAAGIISWEKSSGIFVEATIQEWVLNHIELTEILNYFYMSAHWIVTAFFFVWLFRYHTRVYPYVRNGFLAANALALVIYMLYPVAPPRLMPDGFVDTLNAVSDIDLHGGLLSGLFNPHAAVPSMHFGYAFMIAMVCVVVARSWPVRLLALAYPAVVLFTIVATAHHYLADAAAGGIVIVTGFLAIWLWMAARGQLGTGTSPARVAARTPRRTR